MIRVVMAALHEVEAEAVLRPVSSELAAVTAAGRDVDLRMGEVVRDRLLALETLPVGGAVVTPGGELDASFIIHVAVQSHEEAVSESVVGRALLNGLRRAREWEIRSLVLPPLGIGAGNLEPEAVARVMIPVLRSHLEVGDHPSSVVVAVPNEYEREVFERFLSAAPAAGAGSGAEGTGPSAERGAGSSTGADTGSRIEADAASRTEASTEPSPEAAP